MAIIIIDQALKFYIKLNYVSGESHNMLGAGQNWAQLYFIENEGMAWGWKLGDKWGKLALTLFRLVAVIWGTFLIRGFIKKNMNKGFIICACLIYAGALGNLIDSLFYGVIFDTSYAYNPNNPTVPVIAKAFTGQGYGQLFFGKVVDMLYFPIINNKTLPSWIPFWGGDKFTFFSPIFNIADASISIGIIVLFIFQKRLLGQQTKPQKHQENTVATIETGGAAEQQIGASI